MKVHPRELFDKPQNLKKKKIEVGDRVQSHYDAPWYGVVTEVTPYKDGKSKGAIARVMMLLDRNGNPFRKPKKTTLNVYWLRLTSKLDPEISPE